MQRVVRSEELCPGTAAEPNLFKVNVGGKDVLVCRLEDASLVAFCARCPHQETSLEEASFFDGKLRCARHLYLYDPQTGENIVPARDARSEILWKLKPGYLPVYQVEDRDGWVWVAEQPKPPPVSYNPAREERPLEGTGPLPLLPSTAAAAAPSEHEPETCRVRAGGVLELRIPVTVAPGHLWRLEFPGAALVLEGERFEPGPAPVHRFRLRAGAPGQVTVNCSYVLPWGGTPKEQRTYVVTVEA